MPNVFVINQPKPGPRGFTYDVSPAGKYGDIHFLFGDHTVNPSSLPDLAIQHAENTFSSVYAPGDYFVFAGGDPLSIALATIALLNVVGSSDDFDGELDINWLAWNKGRDGNAGYYTPTSVIN